jgi:hypothetical protein
VDGKVYCQSGGTLFSVRKIPPSTPLPRSRWRLGFELQLTSMVDLYTCATVFLVCRACTPLRERIGRGCLEESWNKILAGLCDFKHTRSARRCCKVLELADRWVRNGQSGEIYPNPPSPFSAEVVIIFRGSSTPRSDSNRRCAPDAGQRSRHQRCRSRSRARATATRAFIPGHGMR